jgi:hypothetical protein
MASGAWATLSFTVRVSIPPVPATITNTAVVSSTNRHGGVAYPSVVTPGTIAGTYIITVPAASGAIMKTGTVTVTVQ